MISRDEAVANAKAHEQFERPFRPRAVIVAPPPSAVQNAGQTYAPPRAAVPQGLFGQALR